MSKRALGSGKLFNPTGTAAASSQRMTGSLRPYPTSNLGHRSRHKSSSTQTRNMHSHELSRSPSSHPSRIYILGVGNIGKLFAHALATKPSPPPITLLLHRENLMDTWEEAGRTIEIVTNGVGNRDGAFDAEIIGSLEDSAHLESPVIENLIVATKATHSAKALLSIRHRLGSVSTILFTQNGLGTVEEVTQAVFPETASRPRYLACVTSHGIYSQGPFSSVHAGQGTISIGPVGSKENDPSFIIQQMLDASVLAVKEVTSSDLKLLQLEKLCVNAMINPLTAIFSRRNGELFSSPSILRLMTLLLAEVSQVIRSLPDFRDDPTIQDRFSLERLQKNILDVAEITAKNTSSMLQDVRANRPTEIDYINGYIVRRGKDLGINCDNNSRLSQLVRQARVISEAEIGQHFPAML